MSLRTFVVLAGSALAACTGADQRGDGGALPSTTAPCVWPASPSARASDGRTIDLVFFVERACDSAPMSRDGPGAFGSLGIPHELPTAHGVAPAQIVDIPPQGTPVETAELTLDHLPFGSVDWTTVTPDPVGRYFVGPPQSPGCRVIAINFGAYRLADGSGNGGGKPGSLIMLLVWNRDSDEPCVSLPWKRW
ncbi:MAG: hypothetical protein AB7L13_19345 [Acidimicrobiia bacterium]